MPDVLTAPEPTLGGGVFITRMALRQHLRTATDETTKKLLTSALADPDACDELLSWSMRKMGVSTSALPNGFLQQLLQFLLTNLPQILALLLPLFGG